MSGTKGKEVEKSKSGETPAKRRRVDGEQPKASAEGEGFGKQETIAEEGHGDWRSPLFYWRGVLAVVKGKGKKNGFVTWKGAWVSSVSGLPPDKEFETSLNDFQLQMEQDTCVLDALLNGEPTASVFARDRLKGKFKGHYLLDQEDGRGLKKYKDKEHVLQVDEDSIVGAVGNTEFGRFVSLGMLKDVTSATTPSVQLTLARRYVSDEDERAKWVSPTQPLKALSEKAGVQEWVGVLETPWKIL